LGSDRARRRARRGDDKGAVVVILAASMGALLVMVALVIDLGGARRDRSGDQMAADAMALAGASALGSASTPGVAACNAAWDYMAVNLPTTATKPAASCSAFAGVCTPTVARQVTATFGAYQVTLTNPVPVGHVLLQERSTANDGTPCDRIGVRVRQSRDNLFAEGTVELDVDAVGRFVRGVGDAAAPLVLLSEHGCSVLRVTGNGALTVHTAAGGNGYIAIDSDGSDCANPNKVVLDVDGQGIVTADKVYMWALADGDATSAYSAGLITPTPVASSARVSRSAMDWRYNCKTTNGCPAAPTAYIDTMVASWGGTGEPLPIGSFTRWTTSGRSCSPSGNTVLPAGNWWIDCGSSGLSTGGTLTFQGGNIVTDGPISASGTTGLRVNCSDANPNDTVAPVTCATDPPNVAAFFQRSGDFVDSGAMELRETMVYTKTGTAQMSGQHTVVWTAPNDPSAPFDDLALWTSSATLMKFTGGSNLSIEGILFAPNANVELAGNTGTQAFGAQIWALKADLVGGAILNLAPKADRLTTVGKGKQLLIR
jgi:Flp pilus assembly protein TadG